MALPDSPIWSRIRSICSSTMLTIVQVGRQPAIWCRKCSSTFWPCWVCITSGCHCTPASCRSTSSNAATGVTVVDASTVKPAGAAVTESPWDIHTVCSAGISAEQRARLDHAHAGAAVLPGAGVRDLAAEAARHQLEAVAHAEDRDACREQVVVDPRCPLGVHRGRAAGQHDRLRLLRRASRPPAWCAARSRSRPGPRAPAARSAGRTAPRSPRRGPDRAPTCSSLRRRTALAVYRRREPQPGRPVRSPLTKSTVHGPRRSLFVADYRISPDMHQGPAGEGGLAGP